MARLTERKKREKREAKRAAIHQQESALLSYLRDYGGEDGIQLASDAAFDSQLKNLSLPVAIQLSEHTEGTIFDIGCGKGILLKRLVDLDEFLKRPKWIYFGIDHPENIRDVISLATDLNVHRRVDAWALSAFYKAWPSIDQAPRPYIAIIRNVFHELDIDQTAQLLHHIRNGLNEHDTFIIQDLQVFPVSERGNACWLPSNFCDLLATLGFDATVVSEPTARGNRWFTVQGRLRNLSAMSVADVRSATIVERVKQLEFWSKLGWLANDDEKFREVQLAKLDFDLQYAALLKQLITAGAAKLHPPTPTQQAKILQLSFAKSLASFQVERIGAHNIFLLQGNTFRDRANYQDGLERFLREDKSVAVIFGGPLVGKTALIKEVLSKRAYDKHVVLIDIQASSSVWNLLELLLSGLGCKIAPDLYGGLRNIRFDNIKEDVRRLINAAAGKTIIAIDHFEQALDPCLCVQDPEIKELLCIIGDAPSAKLMITSRLAPNLDFMPEGKVSFLDGCPMGRFPEGSHVENVLNDLVNLGDLGADKYPDTLLTAIDRHPYLAVLAGLTLKKEGRRGLSDSRFLEKLKGRMRDALLRDLVDENTQTTIKWLSILRIPIPRPMLEALAGKESVRSTEEAGLLYGVYDRHRNDLVTGLGAIRRASGYKDDLAFDDDLDNETRQNEQIQDHARLALEFEDLYRIDGDPRWIRELCYHRLATGDKKAIEQFGTYYKSEIFWAGDYWYRVRKDYEAALWAFDVAKQLGLYSTQAEMRRASCMMRTGKLEGWQLFESLIEQFPNAIHIKNAQIDCLLYLGKFQATLDLLKKYELTQSTSAWVAHEYGRAYFGLREYANAASAFEWQINKEPSSGAFVYDNLARAYQHQGDSDSELRVLTNGLSRYPLSNRLRLRYASHLVREGTPDSLIEARRILEELYSTHTADGRVLQQYCKLLCRVGDVIDARQIWELSRHKISPPEFNTSIHVEILIHEHDWAGALRALRHISTDNEHFVGMKKEVYLAWAKSESDPNKIREIATLGLDVQMDDSLNQNIPVLLMSARLARLAGNDVLYQKFYTRIQHINPAIAEILQKSEDVLSFWEGDDFVFP